jgi:hypothetical protein
VRKALLEVKVVGLTKEVAKRAKTRQGAKPKRGAPR